MRTITLLLTLLLMQQAQEPGSIEGFVLKLGTSDPVARARVVLTRTDGPAGNPLTATTEGDGKFVLRNVAPGKYRLVASRDGYVRAEYGQRGPGSAGAMLTLLPKQDMKDLRIDMMQTGAIAGRVSDRYGDPVGNASVQALKYTYQDGRRVLSVVQSARTNDLGEYRLFWMQPGQYVVSAVPSEGFRFEGPAVVEFGPGGSFATAGVNVQSAVRISGDASAARVMGGVPDTGETYLTVYYPGTTDAGSAAPIDLRSGVNYTGVDLIVADTRAVKVRGRVVNGATNQPAGGTSVSLIPRGAAVGGTQNQRAARTSENGEFEIRGVAPGSYDLVAVAPRQVFFSFGEGGATIAERVITPMPSGEGRLGGRVPLEVGSADVESVTVNLQQGVNIAGRITMEGRSLEQNQSPLGIRVMLRPEPLIPQLNPIPAMVAANGTFTITGVLPGDYRLSVSGVSRNSYVKTAHLNNSDVLNGLMRIDGEPRGALEVVINPNPGTFDAAVVNDRGEPVRGAMVVLVPDSTRRHRSELYRTASSDETGRVHLDGVVPGDYKVFAWDEVEPGIWQDPDFIRKYEDRARAVRIAEGGRENAEVKLIR